VESKESARALNRIVASYTLLLIMRTALSAVSLRLGYADYPFFTPLRDFFADALKSGLAQTSVSRRLLTDTAVRDWPELFQHYLFYNDYLKPDGSIFHSPPLSMLMLTGIAALLLAMSPGTVIALLVSAYAAGALVVARVASGMTGDPVARTVFLLILLAYPSLFMLDRGNIHSGLTSLCVIFHMISAYTGRWRRLSWLALAIALNLRPNVALFAMLELARTPDRRAAITAMVAVAALSIGLGLAAYILVHAVEPRYTPSTFLAALDLYRKNYVDGFGGLFWNASLANTGKAMNYALHVEPVHHPAYTLAASAVGAVMIGVLLMLAWFSRVPGPWLAFALAACCSLFTPVLAEYHLLIFVGPLLLLVQARPEATAPDMLIRALSCLGVLQILCFFQWMGSSALLLPLIALVSLAFPFILLRGTKAAEAVPVAVSLAALSPIGGELTQGLTIGLMLLSALTWLIWRFFTDDRVGRSITGC
jgi:hypothetical protein